MINMSSLVGFYETPFRNGGSETPQTVNVPLPASLWWWGFSFQQWPKWRVNFSRFRPLNLEGNQSGPLDRKYNKI